MASANDDREGLLVVRSNAKRVRRAPATVERIEPPQKVGWVTGQHHVMDDNTGEFMPNHTGPHAIECDPDTSTAFVAPRPRGAVERWLGLIAAALLLASAVVLYWDAFAEGLARFVSESPPRWRAVDVRITSEPVKARVFVGREQRGWTPLSTVEHCRGRNISVRLEAEGYAIWAWGGLCPRDGALDLHGRLNERE